MIKIKNKFLKKMSIYFVGTLSTNMLSVLLVPIYAYFVTAGDLGNYDYVSAIANILTPIVFIVLWEALLKYCINSTKEDIDSYISTSFFFCLMSSATCAMVLALTAYFSHNFITMLLVFLFVAIHGFVSFWQYTSRALGENKRYVVAGISGSVILLIVDIICILFFKLNFIALSISHLISQLAIVIVLETKVKLLSRIRIKYVAKATLIKMAKFSVPLVINNISMWFYSSGTKVIIQNNIGATENGLYSFASKFSMLISLFSTVISMAIIEEAYSFKTLEEYKVKISKLITIISKGYFSLIALALPAIYLLYSIAFQNTEYYMSCDYIFILLLSALFTALSNNFGSSFQVTEKTKYISITTISGAITALVFALIMVKPLGVYGVLIAGLIGPFVMMLLRVIYAKSATGLSLNWTNNILIFLVSFCSYVLLRLYKSVGVQLIIFLVILAFLVFEYRKEIHFFISKIIKNKKEGKTE